MDTYLNNVAVIGAGLGGCAIALALSQKHIPVTVYESRGREDKSLASGVLLTPNGLHVLNQLGVFNRIRHKCYIPKYRVFMNDAGETTKKEPMDPEEKYGYTNHRIWRQLLLDEMRTMLDEREVKLVFDSKFNGITSDTDDGVTFKIHDEVHTASLLIGSDGIYSAVRRHLAPEIQPVYTGLTAVAGHACFDEIDWPNGIVPERNATIQSRPGAIFYIAEDPEASEAMFAMQAHYPEQSRQDLDDLQADHDRILRFFTEKYDEWGETCRRIIDAVERNKHNLYVWPFMKMPSLPRWFSETGRIILIGDGAHALPPSSAQGVNQALEDAWSLGLLLDTFSHQETSLPTALSRWQEWRQKKVDAIFEWTNNTTNVGRLPEAERRKLIAEGKVKDTHGNDMGWLFRFDGEGLRGGSGGGGQE
ncbi:hypothetical protein PRZ48_010430 [Zasmidium cellare]|uniref:FAD-binding domain-containing protein n=1 Tax=Zasmidium cellare TaxID=395010 RepID=A0ABR0E8L4_ZASCE|nr:hypothetical protein PRZ48_010430 [Zasmidium cellare]